MIHYFKINKIKFSFTLDLTFDRLVPPPKLKAGGCQNLSEVSEKLGTFAQEQKNFIIREILFELLSVQIF